MLRLSVLFTLALALAAPAAHAKAIFVTTSDDIVDGVGLCSLRDAVRSANEDIARGGCSAGQDADDIHIQLATLTLSRTGKYDDLALHGDLDVTGELVVHGAPGGTTIDVAGVDRLFETDAPLTLEDLTIRGGRPGPDGTTGVNVLKAWGGAVLARADLTIRRVTFTDNATADGVGQINTVGIDSGSGGAIAAIGGTTDVLVTDSVFDANQTGAGAPKPSGGLSAGGGGDGGALVTLGVASATIGGSRFSANRSGAAGAGGGSFAIGGIGSAIAAGDALVTNTIVSGNVVGAGISASGTGGAVRDAILRHVTVAGNSVDGGSSFIPGGIYGGEVSDSIITGPGKVCTLAADLGGNVSPQGAGCPGEGSDPQLDGSLIPAADSRAIDHATGTCPASDVRAVARPQGAGCDSGAIERRPSSLTLTPGSLTFDSLLPGVTSPQRTLDLTYAGDGALTFGAVSATGDYAATGCTGTTFVDAGTCTITVIFTPTTAGPRAGLVSIATPAGGRSAPLTGSGILVTGPSVPGTPSGGLAGPAAPAAPAATVKRATLGAVTLRRVRGRLRLQVVVRCPAGGARCAESLRVAVVRAGRRPVSSVAPVRLAAGARVTKSIALPRGFTRGLRSGTRLSVRARLERSGSPRVERRSTPRVP